MATPKIVADFETQLSTAVSVGDTSFTLSSATDDDGVALPSGKYYFTIENGSSNKEYVVGTLSGTSITSVSNVSRQGTESSGVDKAHRVGASVIISDFLTYKNYIDETTTAGASDADTNTKGVSEQSTSGEIDADTATGGTGAELFVGPAALAASKYGTQLPSADEKTFLANLEQGNSSVQPQVVTFTSSGTWTKDAGLKYVVVELIGGGGGGGYAFNSDSNEEFAGAGGGAGGYSRKLFLASTLGVTETVTVGAGGAGGTSSGNGASGGTTSFGSLLSATGGSGAENGSSKVGGSGGTGSSGDINITGGVGGQSRNFAEDNGRTSGIEGMGGSGVFGGSPSYGSGGKGGWNSNGTTGTPGIVIVTEYYS